MVAEMTEADGPAAVAMAPEFKMASGDLSPNKKAKLNDEAAAAASVESAAVDAVARENCHLASKNNVRRSLNDSNFK